MAITLTFREATPADATTITTLVQSAYRGDSSRAGWTTEAGLITGARIDDAGVLAKINEPNGVILLAYDAHSSGSDDDAAALIACCELVRRDDGVAYFGLFSVTPMRQGGGIGKQVLARAEDYARGKWGVKGMEMNVIALREELIEWYERRGYARTGKTQPFPYHILKSGQALRDDLDFIVLVKDL